MKISNLLWGVLLIVVGVTFGLNALDIADINLFFDGWWTLFIIIPCFIDLFKDNDKTGNIIGLIIGVCLLLACQEVITFDLIWKLLLPVILIVIGLSIIFKDVINNKIKKLNKNKDNEYYATFSSQSMEFDKDFKGCSLNAIFGSFKCDLRNCLLEEDIVINTSPIFGSVTIYAPNDVNIKVKSNSIFGGVTNNVKNKDGKVTIYINATCLFGGVEIK